MENEYGNHAALYSRNRYCLWHRQMDISVDTFTVDYYFLLAIIALMGQFYGFQEGFLSPTVYMIS